MNGISLFTEATSLAMSNLGYIDPGSGSTIISAIIGIVVASGLAIKTYWYKLKRLFTGEKPSTSEEEKD
jgi:hypothetical protein